MPLDLPGLIPLLFFNSNDTAQDLSQYLQDMGKDILEALMKKM